MGLLGDDCGGHYRLLHLLGVFAGWDGSWKIVLLLGYGILAGLGGLAERCDAGLGVGLLEDCGGLPVLERVLAGL